jgi:plasmid stabilization system protein ParE
VDLRFAPSARGQFLHAVASIRANSPTAALKFRRRAETALRRLLRFPHSGAPVAEFPELPHREVHVKPYQFFYRVEGQTVWVIAVWHGAQVPDEPENG